MAKTLEQLDKEAKVTAKELERLCGAAEASADVIEDQFKKFVPVPVIKRNITELEKELKDGAATLKEAQTIDKEIQKELGGPSTKNPLNKLGKHALALEAAIKKAAKLKTIEGRSDNFTKLLSKVQQKQGEDRKEIQELDDAVKAAAESEKELGEFMIFLPGMAEQIEDNFKKGLPPSVNKTSIAKFESELARMQKSLTTAESLIGALNGLIKKADKFEMDPSVKKDHIAKGKAASTDLEKKYKAADTAHGKLAADLKTYKAEQKAKH